MTYHNTLLTFAFFVILSVVGLASGVAAQSYYVKHLGGNYGLGDTSSSSVSITAENGSFDMRKGTAGHKRIRTRSTALTNAYATLFGRTYRAMRAHWGGDARDRIYSYDSLSDYNGALYVPQARAWSWVEVAGVVMQSHWSSTGTHNKTVTASTAMWLYRPLLQVDHRFDLGPVPVTLSVNVTSTVWADTSAVAEHRPRSSSLTTYHTMTKASGYVRVTTSGSGSLSYSVPGVSAPSVQMTYRVLDDETRANYSARDFTDLSGRIAHIGNPLEALIWARLNYWGKLYIVPVIPAWTKGYTFAARRMDRRL